MCSCGGEPLKEVGFDADVSEFRLSSVDIKGLDLNSGYGRAVLDGFHFDVSEVMKKRS